MSHAPGTKLGGIRTLDDLKGRCRIDTETGCWIWAAGTNGSGVPCMWLPALQATVGMAQAIAVLKAGHSAPAGRVWFATCGNRLCGNPAHRKLGTRSDQMLALKLKRDPATVERMRRKKSKLTPEQIQEIRMDEGTKLADLARTYGLSANYLCTIRSGSRRTGIANTVFNWRPQPETAAC